MEKHASETPYSQLTAEDAHGIPTWVPSEYEVPVSSASRYEKV